MGWFLRGQDTCNGFIDGEIGGMDSLRGHDTRDGFSEGEVSWTVFEGAGYV